MRRLMILFIANAVPILGKKESLPLFLSIKTLLKLRLPGEWIVDVIHLARNPVTYARLENATVSESPNDKKAQKVKQSISRTFPCFERIIFSILRIFFCLEHNNIFRTCLMKKKSH